MELLSDYDKYVTDIYDNLCGFQRNILLALAVPLGKKIEHAYQKRVKSLNITCYKTLTMVQFSLIGCLGYLICYNFRSLL